jgi:tripartite-type tricarboxylate transporter receptor subunit TctC
MKSARIAFWAIAFLVALSSGPVSAQTQIRIMSGYPPGGAVDALARIFAERLAEALGRPVVVETRAGAAGQISAMAVKTAPPDGNTLMVVPDSQITLYPHTVSKPVYDTLKDFLPVAHLGSYPIAFAIHPNIPARDLQEFLAWAKAAPKNAAYGSGGVGSTLHFLGLIVGQATGVPLVHVAYRGVGPAMTDVIAGQVPAVILPLGTLLKQAAGGKVRILAHSGSARSAAAPDIPTFKELGYSAVEANGWFGLFAAAGTAPEIVARYNSIVIQAIRTAATRERLRALDLEIREMTPAEIAASLKAEYDRWAPIVKASGFSADSR